MQWLNDIQDWFLASENQNTVLTGIILFISMILALVIGALIGSSVSKRHIRSSDNMAKATVIAALIDSATEASVWNGLSPQEQIMSDRAVGQIDIRVRLMPVKGSAAAADWAAHQLAEMKRTSATFGYQLDPAVAEFRDRLLLWVANPGRANKIFARDLERWAYQSVQPQAAAAASQDAWVAQQYSQDHKEDDLSSLLGESTPTAPVAAPAPVSSTKQLLEEVDGLSALRSPASDDDDQNLPRVF
jgi:hypothetical protein